MSPLPRVCAYPTCSGHAIPGGSRCPQHRRGNWERRKQGPSPWNDPEYNRNRAEILRDRPICHWCQATPADTADHLKAVAEGGSHDLENLVPSCSRCNQRRGASLGGKVTKLRRRGR